MGILPLEFRCYHAYKLRYTLFRMHFWFMVAIFDLSLTQTTDSFKTCGAVLLDIRNVKIALKNKSLSCCIQPEKYAFPN